MSGQIQKIEVDVLPFREAMDYAQSLESRGDFKYKGIYAIFNHVFEATLRFTHNKILPDVDQLQKELAIPKEKFDEYIKELTGRGSLKSLVLVDFPAVDFLSGSGGLISLTILCRPTQQDGTSFKNYYDYYKNRSIDAFKKWISRKESKWQGSHRESILSNLDEKQYNNSHAGAVIHYYMQNPLDKTNEQKLQTYKNYTKNVIQELINERTLFYVKGEGSLYTMQFPDKESYMDRFGMLLSKLTLIDSNLNFTGEINLQNLEEYSTKIQNIKISKQIPLFFEFKIVVQELIKIFKEKEEREKKEKLQKLLEELLKYEWVVPASTLKNLKREDIPGFLSLSDVLHTEFFYGGKVVDFLLHKKNIFPAVVHARKQFLEKHNETELRIILQMDVGKFLQGEQLKIYKSAEEELLFAKLPWYLRFFRLFFSKEKIKESEKEQIREKIRKEEIESQIHYKRKEAAQMTKEIAKKKIEPEKKPEEVREPQVDLYEQDVQKLQNTIQKDEKAKELLLKIINVLDEAWDRGELPNRITLLERIEDFKNNEDYLIQFLKKYGKGAIFSFRVIPHDPKSPKIDINDPVYVWPILISKKYIIKNGNRLLKKAMEEVDAQKSALMPEQQKFDIATSIEDFLNRILSKKK
ncbi:MAG: hypothetical protein ACK4UJ_09765 [Leptonema sp. (in: bacteria)]